MGCCNAKQELNEIARPEPVETQNTPEEEVKEEEPKKPDKYKEEDYAIDALKWINFVRQYPKEFIEDIEEAKNNIKSINEKLVYAGKVKVFLKEGEKAFDNAIAYLNEMEPVKPLTLTDEIIVKVPEEEELAKNPKELKVRVENKMTELKELAEKKRTEEPVEEKKTENILIENFFKDSVKNAYVSVLLLVIDDSGKDEKKKREAILNPNYTKIGIDYRKFNKQFTAYYTFSS